MGFLTIKYTYKPNKEERNFLIFLGQISKNIYNLAIYNLKQYYLKTKKLLSDRELFKILYKNVNFHLLTDHQKFAIARKALLNFKHFYYHQDTYKIPNYKNRYETMPIFESIAPYKGEPQITLSLKQGLETDYIFKRDFKKDEVLIHQLKKAKITKPLEIKLPIPIKIQNKKVHELTLKHEKLKNLFTVYLSYSDDFKVMKKPNDKVMAIDLGITNLASCVSTEGDEFLIDGKILKSMTYHYENLIKNAQILLPKGIFSSKKILELEKNRNNKIEDALNIAAKIIITKALEKDIRTIVIGYNENFKARTFKNVKKKKLRKRLNKIFHLTALVKLKDKIIFKGKQEGINVITIEESYTSKASFYDNDDFKEPFSGTRVKRGTYTTKTGKEVNADINAALNILKKYSIVKHNFLEAKLEALRSKKAYPVLRCYLRNLSKKDK